MAIVAPVFVTVESGQSAAVVITVTGDVSAYALAFKVRGYAGGTALISKTSGSGISAAYTSSTAVTVTLTAADLTLAPGLYEWTLERTDVGSEYPVVDRSGFMVTAASGAAYPRLCNLATYLASLGQSETVSDTDAKQYLWALSAAESALKRACNRQFTYASRTAYLAPAWTDTLLLPETPVESITSLYYDPSAVGGQNTADFDSTTLLVLGDDYFLERDRPGDTYSESGKIRRIGGVWAGRTERGLGLLGTYRAKAPGTVKVVYTAGYGNAIRPPEDLLEGIFLAATLIRKAAPEGGRLAMSESGEGESVSYGNLDAEVRRLASTQWVVSNYKRHVI
jgi:hypothetical protein